MSLRVRAARAASARWPSALPSSAAFAVTTIATSGRRRSTILGENYRSVLAAQRMKEAIERLDRAALLAVAGQPERADARRSSRTPRPSSPSSRSRSATSPSPARRTPPRPARRVERLPRGASRLHSSRPPAAASRCYFAELEPRFAAARGRPSASCSSTRTRCCARATARGAQAGRRRRCGGAAALAALAALVAGIAASVVAHAPDVRPLAVLRRRSSASARGDLRRARGSQGATSSPSSRTAFNAMADRIAEYRRSSLGELLQAQQAAQAAIDSLPDPVLVFAPDGEVLIVNRAAEALLGAAKVEPPTDSSPRTPPLREAIEAVRAHVLRARAPTSPRGFEEAVRSPARTASAPSCRAASRCTTRAAASSRPRSCCRTSPACTASTS